MKTGTKKRRLVYLSAGCYWRYCSKIIEKWQKKNRPQEIRHKKNVASEKCHCFECVFRRIGSKQTTAWANAKKTYLVRCLIWCWISNLLPFFFYFVFSLSLLCAYLHFASVTNQPKNNCGKQNSSIIWQALHLTLLIRLVRVFNSLSLACTFS